MNGYDEEGFPVMIKGEPLYKYYKRLDKFTYDIHCSKRDKILKFINLWFSYKYQNKEYFKKIWYFKDVELSKCPDNGLSKKFMNVYFQEYNLFFDLELEYEEDKFTTYNVLYMIKLMLKTIKGHLKRDKIDNKIKYYTIKVK